MSLIDLSIKRPIFISCLIFLIMAVGALALKRMPVDLYPDVTFPVVTVNILYPGAAPEEVETLVSKPIEDELSQLSGIKNLRSINKEGVSITVAEFTLETDVKYAEQQVRDHVSSLKRKLPTDIKEPVYRRIEPSDTPILILALRADLGDSKLFDLADQVIRPKIERIDEVGLVQVIGGRKREIHVELDRNKLKAYEISASQVSGRIASAGENIPAGKVSEGSQDTVFRSLAQFKWLPDIADTIVSFTGNDVAVRVRDLGKVTDSLQDETARTYYNGQKGVFLKVFRHSGANTIRVADAIFAQLDAINGDLKAYSGSAKLETVRDGSKAIRENIDDVRQTIFLGVLLTLIVVYFFLGNARSTFITGIAIPNSLIGAFFLMGLAGLTVNTMSLLGLSLAVGLLIDDAIVVRENIFRHIELGKKPKEAALFGAKEVQIAVIATTLTVIAVFGPIGFIKGIPGQFFRQFGLTVCFVMVISLFDALTAAPMLSAHFAGASRKKKPHWLYRMTLGRVLSAFDRFQDGLVGAYERVLNLTLRHPLLTLALAFGIFVASLVSAEKIPKTFLPEQDNGEFTVTLELSPGANLNATQKAAGAADAILHKNPEVTSTTLTIGNLDGESNSAEFFVKLVPLAERQGVTTSVIKANVREELKELAYASPVVKDYDEFSEGQRPFNLILHGDNLPELEKYSAEVFRRMKQNPGLTDPELSLKPGKPEFQVVWDPSRGETLGVSSSSMGAELRNLVEGVTPALFREAGRDYDIRVRLEDDQRNLHESFYKTYVPNVNFNLVRLSSVAHPVLSAGPSNIIRHNRGRSIQIGADMTPRGKGMRGVMLDIEQLLTKDMPMPAGIHYSYLGQAEDFQELGKSMALAMGLAVVFIYLVLASLYESLVTPFTIMLVLPLGICGALFALRLGGQSLDMFSMIGCVMLLGIATKNSILLVDYMNHLIARGWERKMAIVEAGRVRLRPILMTSFALIAGMLPVAVGLNESSRQRVSMGTAIIGGLISSTLLSLIVVPAAFLYMDRLRAWLGNFFSTSEEEVAPMPEPRPLRVLSPSETTA